MIEDKREREEQSSHLNKEIEMYWSYLTGRKTKVGYGFDYCEDIHTERSKNDIKIVFTSRRERVECSLKDFDFRIEQEDEE